MPCDTRLKANQTISQRAEEVRAVTARASQALAAGRVKALVGPQGAIAFTGLSDAERDGVTDACLYRRLMSSGSATARLAVERAEILAGRKVDQKTVAIGAHSHDGGRSWHSHKG